MKIRRFAIFSERNSGSNYVRTLIENNFGLEYCSDYGFKHWWLKDVPHRPPRNQTTDCEARKGPTEDSDDVLFIVLARNPVEWLRSMYVRPHHLRGDLRERVLSGECSFEEFLDLEWVCEEDEKRNDLWNDSVTGKYFIETAKNVIDIRNQKYRHWMHLFDEDGPRHVCFANYENFPTELTRIGEKYKLEFRNGGLQNYRRPAEFQNSGRHRPTVSDDLRKIIVSKLDLEAEKALRYHLILDQDQDHEVMSVIGKRDFKKFAIIADHICLQDWAERLREVLSRFHKDVELHNTYPVGKNDECWDPNVLYFFFNVHARPVIKHFPVYFILVQSEVYPTPYFERETLRSALLFAQETWDYSATNTRRLRHDLGRSNYYHVPFPSRPNNFTGDEIRDIDILFVGTLGPWRQRPDIGTRRQPILSPIVEYFRKQKRKVEVIERGIFGEKLLSIYRRTKVLLNLHYYYDVQPLEQPRVVSALECGVTVVSEEIPPEDLAMISCEHLIFSPKEMLMQRIEDILTHYSPPSPEDLVIRQTPTALGQVQRLRRESGVGRADLPLVALHMIVRNEARNLRVNLPKLVELFDYFIMVDTGSTDDTIAYLLEFYETLPQDKKGIVVQRTWIDEFDQSRNESLRLCRGRVRWAMTLDADDVLQFKSAAEIRGVLKTDAADFFRISMKEHRASISYNRCALVSAVKPFMFRYKLHEAVGPRFKNARCGIWPRESMYIERGIMRGCRSHDTARLQKDIDILKKCYKIEPEEDKARYCFYLAQSYYDSQQWAKAHKYYLLRSTMGTYLEEVYVSLWKAAVCMLHLQKPKQDVIRLLRQAIEVNPRRIETIYKIAEILRKDNKFREGFEWGMKGIEKQWNRGFEFGLPKIYRYQLIDEVSVCAPFCDEAQQGKLLLMGLLRAVPETEFTKHEYARITRNYELMKRVRPTLAVYAGYSYFFTKNTKHFGGSEIALLQVLPVLQENGFDVFVFCIDSPEDRKNNEFTKCGIQVFGIDEFKTVVDKQHKKRFDAVIVHRFIHYFLLAKKSWAVSTYVWLHDNCFHPYWNGQQLPFQGNHLMGQLADGIHSVVTSSTWHRKMIADSCPEINPKLRVVHLGLDLSAFPDTVDVCAKKKWRFVWISDPSRGFDEFYRIFFWFKYNVYPRASLHVYGNATTDHLPAEYEKDRNRLRDVVFHGYCKDRKTLAEALLKSDVFLYPLSLGNISHETFCLSVVEAMAAGCIVICPARAALTELVNNDRGRLLRSQAQPADYCGVLEQLHEDYDDCSVVTLRKKAVEFARKFTWKECAEQWFRLLTRSAHLYGTPGGI